MDEQTQQTAQSGEDQELARVLDGVQQEANAAAGSGLQFDDTAQSRVEPTTQPAEDTSMPQPSASPTADQTQDQTTPAAGAVEMPTLEATPEAPVLETPTEGTAAQPMAADPALDAIKDEALNELRPLVDKLNVSPEEKFDTYLLLLRSTDDKALIAPAHEIAQSITDEEKKAQALLEIIKEIDYLSKK